ncbi:RBBP9/YdeN family alpha/beta hydrolase [Mesoplasma photuris]|uniref:RBBP9/YdeN family alpha/beta hydrolase n=1 Tax=Mesoplasma photuris TaxID=217731 RepID=UPI0004E1D440|nr:alpha/beta hydrolase [Mesoplasma photuris]
MPKYVLIHGFMSNETNAWYPWFKKTIEARGDDVTVFSMPNASRPKVNEWIDFMKKNINWIDIEDTIFVGHSLGTITILNYLSDVGIKPYGVALVSGFYEPVTKYQFVKPFTEWPLNWELLKSIDNKLVLTTKTDSIVNWQASKSLADQWEAEFICLEDGGHFMEKEGCFELPILLESLDKFK